MEKCSCFPLRVIVSRKEFALESFYPGYQTLSKKKMRKDLAVRVESFCNGSYEIHLKLLIAETLIILRILAYFIISIL